jgi:hypothetical protein
MRGIEVHGMRTLPALVVPVLETGMEEAVTLAESMDSRGHGRGSRSRYRPEHWTVAAVTTTALGAVAAVAYLVAAARDLGDLRPATDPLAWPSVAPALVGAALLLATPGLFRRPPA